MTLEEIRNLTNSEIAVALYFSTPNCGVCEALLPKLHNLFRVDFPKIRFQHIGADRNPEIAANFNVFAAPTLLVFFEGKEFSRNVRNLSILQLKEKLKRPYDLLGLTG